MGEATITTTKRDELRQMRLSDQSVHRQR